MRLFVTGGTGFIGGAFARLAVASGHDVTALVRDPARAEGLRALGIHCVRGDIILPQTLPDAMEGNDAVAHFAAWYELGVPRAAHRRMYEVNVTGTANVLAAARRAAAPRVLYCSTVGWLGKTAGRVASESFVRKFPPSSAYERTKMIAHERALEAQRDGLPVTIVMPGAVYGPGDPSVVGTMLRVYRTRLLRVFVAPDAGFSWVHVDDVARGALLALERGGSGESYILGGDNLRFRELFALLGRLTGIPSPWFLPAGPLRALRPLGRVPLALGPLSLALLDEGIGSLGVYFVSSDKARRELGYDPRAAEVGFAETLERLRGRALTAG